MGLFATKSPAKVVQKAMDYHNAKDTNGLKSIGTKDAKVFVKGKAMDWSEYCEAFQNVTASFPDIKFEYDPLVEKDKNVFINKITVTGSHTGEPYGFGDHPKIEPTTPPKQCVNDQETIEFTVEKGKIKEMIIMSPEGATSGPPGFYTQIGGKIE